MTKDPFFLPDAGVRPGVELTIQFSTLRKEVLALRILEFNIHRCPAYFFISFPVKDATRPPWTNTWQAAAGRGLTRSDAHKAAIAEAIERATLTSQGFGDPRTTTEPTSSETRLGALDVGNFDPNFTPKKQAFDHEIAGSSCGNLVDNLWIKCHNRYTSKMCWISATAILFGEDLRLGFAPEFSTSTGTATHLTPEQAQTHAIDELVERDGVAIWWYNRLVTARLSEDDAAALLPAALGEWLQARKRQTHWLVVPTDLPRHVLVAISARRDGSGPAIGASAAADPRDAIRSATLEMLQGEIALSQMRAAQVSDDPPPVPPLLAWSETTNVHETPYLCGEGTAGVRQHTGSLAEAFDRAGVDIYIADLTLEGSPLPVVKAVSPQLRDWLPRFGPGRLYDVPVSLGLQDAPTPEEALNPIPFVI